MRDRLADQESGLRAGPFDAENRDKSGLSRGRVAADRLAGLPRRALDIEEVVGDLEGGPGVMGRAAQGESELAARLSEDPAGLAGKGDEGAGLEVLHPGGGTVFAGR